MTDVSLIVLCAGTSSRFDLQTKKQWLRVGNEPLWVFVTKKLCSYYSFDKVVLTSHIEELNYMQNFTDDYKIVAGGDSRQESMKNALEHIDSKYVMITDVARACIPKEVIERIIGAKNEADCVVPYINVSDTVVYESDTINRDSVKLIQTPQLSKTECLKEALNTKDDFTDDSSAIKAIGGKISYVLGDIKAKKLTFNQDIKDIPCLKKPSNNFFTGIGFDIHPFEDDKEMFLGGVHIDSPFGFKAHSDGDVLIHSVIDALLGAIGAGDIGEFFPDTDQKYKNVDSKELLKYIVAFLHKVGYEIINVDLTIIAQKPKINPYKTEIKSTMAKLLNIEKPFINIKATTAEKLGFVGRGEGVAVKSIATVKYYNWMEE